MFNFLKKIKTSGFLLFKITFLYDLWPHIKNAWQVAQLILDFFLKTSSSFAKLLAPAMFGQTLEMLAKGENQYKKFGIELSVEELFYLFIFLTIFLQIEKPTRKFLTADVKSAIIREYSFTMINKIYNIDLATFERLSGDIGNYFYFIQDSCHKFNNADNLFPSIVDILLGIIAIGSGYGSSYAIGFLVYALSHTLFYNKFLNQWSGLDTKEAATTRKTIELTNDFYNNLRKMKTTKIFDQKNLEIRILNGKVTEFTQAMKVATSADAKFSLMSRVPAFIIIFFVIKNYLHLLKNRDLNEINNFVFLVGYLFAISESINSVYSAFCQSLVAVRQLEEANNLFAELREISLNFNPVKTSKPHYAVQFKNVSFWFDEKKPILTNINFAMESGKCYGLVGPSGSGKSILTELLMCLRKPTKGTIEIQGIDTQYISAQQLSNIVSLIGQTTELSDASALFNILYGDKKNEDYLYQLLYSEKAQRNTKKDKPPEEKPLNSTYNFMLGIFKKMTNKNTRLDQATHSNYHSINNQENPDKILIPIATTTRTLDAKEQQTQQIMQALDLQKSIFDHPQKFSGGEQQRIGLARSLLAPHADVIIYDESTSNLDPKTEKKVLKAIRNRIPRDKTLLFISHRETPINAADAVFKLEEGNLTCLPALTK